MPGPVGPGGWWRGWVGLGAAADRLFQSHRFPLQTGTQETPLGSHPHIPLHRAHSNITLCASGNLNMAHLWKRNPAQAWYVSKMPPKLKKLMNSTFVILLENRASNHALGWELQTRVSFVLMYLILLFHHCMLHRIWNINQTKYQTIGKIFLRKAWPFTNMLFKKVFGPCFANFLGLSDARW